MIRKIREKSQVDLFGKDNILPEEPSFLNTTPEPKTEPQQQASGMRKIEIERTFRNPILMGQFNGTAQADDESTENVVKEINLKRNESEIKLETEEIVVPEKVSQEAPIAFEELAEVQETLSEEEAVEAAERETGTITRDRKPRIINRDFADGFHITGVERKILKPDPKRIRRERRRQRLILKVATISLLTIFAMILWNWQDWVANSSLFTLKNIYVQGNVIGAKDEIIQAAALDQGTRLAEIDLVRVSERVKKNPLFERVNVSRNYPSSILITVTERQPFAFVATSDLQSVDPSGYVLPKLKARMIYNLPVISGASGLAQPGKKFKDERLVSALQFLAAAKSIDESLFYDISEVVITKQDLTVFLNSVHTRFKVDDENPERSAVYLGAAAQQFKQDPDIKNFKEVDLRFAGQILVRK